MSIRVRYAPSPTGSPHVGNIRDALFKHLLSKHHRGVNILRIEDSDRTRFVPGSESEIIESLNWLGIEWQEGPDKGGPCGPYRQSERKDLGIYQEKVEWLLDQGYAYKAFDTPEELAEMREYQQINKHSIGYFGGIWRDAGTSQVEKAEAEKKAYVIRLKIPKNTKISIEDEIRGRIEWDSGVVDDPVLIKADGMPTYHFGSMVDDHLMRISHIIRGEEWISSAPKHACLFDAFGWERPIFVHCPIIKGKDGGKLSKRHGDTRCLDFRDAGYLPEALANFISLIGWSPKADRELLSMDELIEAFDLDGLQPSPGIFDIEKLNWMNGHYIRQKTPENLMQVMGDYLNRPDTEAYWARPRLEASSPKSELKYLQNAIKQDPDYAIQAIKLEQDRVQTLAELGPATAFFFEEEPPLEEKAVQKWLYQDHVSDLLDTLENVLKNKGVVTAEACEDMLRTYAREKGFEKLGPVVHPTRVTMTGKTVGPGLFELMSLLGPERMLRRIDRVRTQVLKK